MSTPRSLRYLCFVVLGSSFFCSALAGGQTPLVRNEVKHDVSPPLRDMVRTAFVQQEGHEEAEPVRTIPLPPGFKPPGEPDLALQRTTAAAQAASSPTLINNFEGIGSGLPNFFVQVAPPDTNGAVGLTQYVQWVNINFAVFDKITGSILAGFPVPGNTLWSGFGGPCETNNDGDIIVLYDQINNRWIFGQFAVRNLNPPPNFLTNSFQCVAVSTSSDVTGSYNRYAFEFMNEFDDYPKMAVWPDAYYATFNIFNPSTLVFEGVEACAFDGNAMRNGQTATAICLPNTPLATEFGLLPSNLDGQTLPPPGSPNFMMDFAVNSLNLFRFHVDFTTPANSTFTGPTNIPVTAFTPFECSGSITCVPQSGTTQLLDTLGDRLMYRLAYRNFGTHESLVVNHSVIAGTSSGIRWYEIQSPNGTPVVAQQSTYAPNTNFRWMGSIAMDVSGDMALGYSVSSASIFPQIAVTGRAASDPASTMQAETSVISGNGAQIGGLSRWGDYSAMQIDPLDDCTFWYTQEYIATTGNFNWNTRIASFNFPGVGVTDLAAGSAHTGSFAQGETGQTYSIKVSNVGCKPSDGTTVTVTDTLPTGLTATDISGTGWSCTLGTLTCTRSDVLNPNTSYSPITLTVNVGNNAPASVTNTVVVAGGGNQNTKTNSASDLTTIVPSPDLTVALSHSPDPFTVAQSGTYTIVVSNVGNVPTSGVVTMSDPLPSGLTATAISATGWTCSGTTSVSCSRSDALPVASSYPSIVLTVNVNGGGSPVSNTATVSGGGEFDTANDAATDHATIVPLVLTLNSTAAVTVTAGGSGSFTFTTNLSTGQGVGTVTFNVSGLPANSMATFSPSSLTQTGQVTMTVATSGNGTVASLIFGNFDSRVLSVGLCAFLGLCLSVATGRRRRWLWATASLGALAFALLLVGCGGGGSTPPPVTPPGTYALTVTAASSNSSLPTASVPVTLTVH